MDLVLRRWVKTDAAKAWAWLEVQSEDVRSKLDTGLIAAMTELDPPSVEKWLEQRPHDGRTDALVHAWAYASVHADCNAVAERLDAQRATKTVPSEMERSLFALVASHKLNRRPPDVDWFIERMRHFRADGTVRSTAVQAAGASLVGDAVDGARMDAALLRRERINAGIVIPEVGSSFGPDMERAFRSWVYRDPRPAVAWLESAKKLSPDESVLLWGAVARNAGAHGDVSVLRRSVEALTSVRGASGVRELIGDTASEEIDESASRLGLDGLPKLAPPPASASASAP